MANELRWASQLYTTLAPAYKLFENYYDGKQANIFTSEQMSNNFFRLVHSLRDNLMPTVVNALADRLQLAGFSATENATANDYLSNVFFKALDTKAGLLHSRAITTGDSYAIVWPNAAGQATVYPQKTNSIVLRYEESDLGEDVIAEAVKTWQASDGRLRVIRYLPDRIERYVTKAKSGKLPESTSVLIPYAEDGLEPVQINPYGRVPVFRFANGNEFASSELKDVVPIQDLINKTIVDMAVASEYQALPQRWITGAQRPRDPATGELVKLESGPSSLWTFQNPDTKLGQFEAADLSKFLEVLNDLRLEVARISRTPAHLFMLQGGDFPSGEALRTAEAPLSTKIRDRQNVFGETWEEIAEFACQIEGIATPGDIDALWENTQPNSELEQTEVALNKQTLGVGREQILAELGYSAAQIDAMNAANAVPPTTPTS